MTNDEKIKSTKEISEKEKEIVIARLEVLFPELCFASGNDRKSYSRDQLIEEIKNNSEVGIEFVKIEMEFLKALKNGSLIKRLNQAMV